MLMCLAMLVSACGSDSDSPTQPSNIIQVAGTWTGTYLVTRCTEPPLLPLGAPVCNSLVPVPGTTGTPQPLTFRLTQNDTVLGGTMTFTGWLGTTGLTVPLTGSIEKGGAFLLQATQNTNDPACPALTIRTTLSNFTATINRDRNAMTLGTFQLVTSRRAGTTGCVYYDVEISAEQMAATLQGTATR
jgi:hypothetical protein